MSGPLLVAIVLAYLSLFVVFLPRILEFLDRGERALVELCSRPARRMQSDLLSRRDVVVEHVCVDGELLEFRVGPGWTVGEVVDLLGAIDRLPTLDIQRHS